MIDVGSRRPGHGRKLARQFSTFDARGNQKFCSWYFLRPVTARPEVAEAQAMLACLGRRRKLVRLPMHEMKDTPRALVRIGFDGRVHKTFRGHMARERFEHEVRVLRHLEARGCTWVPRLLEVEAEQLKIVTTNCGQRVDHLSPERQKEIFAELEEFGVRHEDRELRNITYRTSDGRFCVIDFEFATLLDGKGDAVSLKPSSADA